jgi:acyl phosphate:glycerol-3-phosphate acyltransferase
MPDIATPILYWPLLLVGAYLLGSVPFSQLLARTKGVDLRQVGSGNVGAGNLTREVGLSWGVTAAVLDGLKGLFPVWIALKAGLGPGASGLAGVAAIVGHNWSIWLRGRSGRGLAPAAGVMVALDPVLLVWIAGWSLAGWKIGSGLGGFLGWGLLPIVAVAMGRPPTETLLLALLSIILMARRAQGNQESVHGRVPALKRVIYDTDNVADEYPEPIEGPLTP